MCCKAIEDVFENDPVGNVTLEVYNNENILVNRVCSSCVY